MSYDYLSDEELQKLISDIELNDMVEAPANISGKVLEAIDSSIETESKNKVQNKKRKIIEYRLYKFKVASAVAAAIAVMFLVPHSPVINKCISVREEYVSKITDAEREKALGNVGTDNRFEMFSEKNICITLMQKREEAEMRLMNMFNR